MPWPRAGRARQRQLAGGDLPRPRMVTVAGRRPGVAYPGNVGPWQVADLRMDVGAHDEHVEAVGAGEQRVRPGVRPMVDEVAGLDRVRLAALPAQSACRRARRRAPLRRRGRGPASRVSRDRPAPVATPTSSPRRRPRGRSTRPPSAPNRRVGEGSRPNARYLLPCSLLLGRRRYDAPPVAFDAFALTVLRCLVLGHHHRCPYR